MRAQHDHASPWIAGAAAAALMLAALALPATARADGDGAAAYKAQCIGCHGADGSGQTPIGKSLKVQDLSKPEIQAMKDADLAAVIEKGKGKMPTFKGKLSAAQIGKVVDYIRTLAKAK
jgi:cytochrome c6